MRDWQGQSHVKWYCKYHIVFVPKYRRRAIYGAVRKQIGGILRDLCRQEGIDLVEGHAMPDHIHLMRIGLFSGTDQISSQWIQS